MGKHKIKIISLNFINHRIFGVKNNIFYASLLIVYTASLFATYGLLVVNKSQAVSTAPASGGYFTTLPLGSALPSDSECASRVHRSTWEPRTENLSANYNVPSSVNLANLSDYNTTANTVFKPRITGNFTGTTDEIIQWASCKWGFNDDIFRAQALVESSWKMSATGDLTTSTQYCPTDAAWSGTSCYESYGLLQNRWRYNQNAYPMYRTMTAFHMDYSLMKLRACYEGYKMYLGSGYAAGDLEGCLGNWNSGGWKDAQALNYVATWQNYMNTKPWLTWTDYGSTRPPTDFVSRKGQQLLLNGQPFRMIGFNIWRANVNFQLPNTNTIMGSGTALDDALTNINANNGKKNTLRAWFFQQEVTPGGGAYNWTPFDHTLAVAKAHGFKVIATLEDQWDWQGPPYKDTAWYSGGYKTTVFSGTANGVAYAQKTNYRQYVQDVVTRYKDDPTIAAWELMNEPQDAASDGGSCPANAANIMYNFTADVSGLIKGIDPNHLVSLGATGTGNCGINEGEYQTIMGISTIDLCSFHDYEGAANATAFETWNGLNIRIPQCAAINKPIYIGEVGASLNTVGTPAARATYIDAKMAAQFAMQGVVGYIPWEWYNTLTPTDEQYGPGDPVLPIMDKYALSTTKIGDINNDSSVNIFDLSMLLSNWNQTGTNIADLNSDNLVNIFDLSILLSKWGT